MPPRQHPVQGQMPGDPAARGAVPPPAKMVPEAPHPHRAGVFVPRGAGAEPGDGVEDHEGAVQPARVAWKKVFPHNLRHLFARTFYEVDKNIAKLADLLGHSSIETTRIYIMESGEEHRRLMERMHLLL